MSREIRAARPLAPLLAAIALLAVIISPSRALAAPYRFSWGNPKPQGNALWGVAFEDASIGYAVGEKGATLRTTDGGQTWSDRTHYSSASRHFYDLLILAPADLLAVGENPGIFRSSDGGETWTAVTNPSFGDLRNIHRLDAATLTAVGDTGQILRSTDGGATWTSLTPTGTFENFDQFWWSAMDGYVCGSGKVQRTTDGGLTWTPLPGVDQSGAPVFTDIKFLDAMNGWVTEHFDTWRTTNGGASWFRNNEPFFPFPIYQAETMVLDASTRFVITDLEGAGIWKTTNDGMSWTTLYERNTTRGYTDIERLPDGALVVVSSDGDLLRSTDAGLTWDNYTHSPEDGERYFLEAIEVLPDGRAFAGGYGSLWIASTDWGRSWTIPPASPNLAPCYDIEFLDGLGLAGGFPGAGQSVIKRTSDGGATWTSHSLAPTYVGYPQGIAMPDAGHLYVVTHAASGSNHAYRSTDGGFTWEPREQDLGAERLECIAFVDANTGFVGGRLGFQSARVWKTTDGGGAWTMLPSAGIAGGRVVAMHWTDASVGVIASDGGISRTTNGGQSWTLVLAEGMTDLSFRDPLNGVAAEYVDDNVWTTSDGGVTWSELEIPWNGFLRRVAAIPGGFLVCGNANVVLVGEDLSDTVVPGPAEVSGGDGCPISIGVNAPQRLTIAPNPSTGAVHLHFDSTADGPCRVSVFDASGRRVAAFERTLPVGAASLGWDARDASGSPLAPGVYLLALRDRSGALRTGRVLLLPR